MSEDTAAVRTPPSKRAPVLPLEQIVEVAVGPNPDGHTDQAINTHVDHPDAAAAPEED